MKIAKTNTIFAVVYDIMKNKVTKSAEAGSIYMQQIIPFPGNN